MHPSTFHSLPHIPQLSIRHMRSEGGRRTLRGKLQKQLRKLSWPGRLQRGMPSRRPRRRSGWAKSAWRSRGRRQMSSRRGRQAVPQCLYLLLTQWLHCHPLHVCVSITSTQLRNTEARCCCTRTADAGFVVVKHTNSMQHAPVGLVVMLFCVLRHWLRAG